MHRRVDWMILLLLVPILALSCSDTGEPPPPPSPPPPPPPTTTIDPVPFPPGFDYPLPASTLQGWVDKGEGVGDSERGHAWNLWAGLNQPASATRPEPVWRTWYTTTQTFRDNHADGGKDCSRPTSLNAKNAANAPLGVVEGLGEQINFSDAPQYPVPETVRQAYPDCYCAELDMLVDGQMFENNGDIMIAGVIYNKAANDWIESQKLFSSDKLNSLMPKSATDPATQMPPMPAGSMVLKVMQWPVQGSGFTALPVWNPNTPFDADNDSYAGYEIQRIWKDAVAVSASAGSGTQTVTYLYGVLEPSPSTAELGPITYTDAPVFSVGSFYNKQYSEDDLNQMDRCDRALLDASALYTYDRNFQAGDYLVTMAMHIITKEQPTWTFQSAWWSNNPKDEEGNRYAQSRPDLPNAQGPWDHYLITTTYGQAQKAGKEHVWPDPLGTLDNWPVAFNPYIELAAAHPIVTNCMNCHHRAAWPSRLVTEDDPRGSYLASGAGAASALTAFTETDSEASNYNQTLPQYEKIFDGLLMTDSQWSLSDRANTPKPSDG